MAELLRMPEVAANMESAVLSSWSVAEGSSITAREVIAVIETDKAIVDYEAEVAGTLVRRLVREGAEVEVGAPIALIAQAGEVIADIDATLRDLGIGAGGAEGAPAPVEPVGAAQAQSVSSSSGAPGMEATQGPANARRFISPLARRLARAAGLDIATIVGTGPHGRIVRRDVDLAVSSQPSAGAAAASTPAALGDFVDTAHSRLRRAIASRLTESKTTAPHFYLRGTATVDRLLRLREEINDGADLRVSVNDLLIKAIAKAHLHVPAMNVIWLPDAIRSFASVDIAVAIATPNGLVTPVVRSVERLTVTEVAATVRDFADRGRAGRLQQHELEGGSISISNLGMYGTQEFAAIINPPHAAILAVGATRQEPVVIDGALAVGTVMQVTLSVDHRPVDGVVAAEWMRAFIALLERPGQILA